MHKYDNSNLFCYILENYKQEHDLWFKTFKILILRTFYLYCAHLSYSVSREAI